LATELRTGTHAGGVVWGGFMSEQPPGIVNVPEPGPQEVRLDAVFARQQLPNAVEQRGASVAALAESAYGWVEGTVDRAAGAFTIHAFAPTGAEAGLSSRAELVAAELLARLRQRRRRAARQYLAAEQAAASNVETKLLVQILLVSRERAWISAAVPRSLDAGGWDLSPFVAGIAAVPDDPRPPSRAYRKLEEAFLWMAAEPRPGALCVDLGAAPGGWTYAALRRGARVIAVDRAPLAAPVHGHPLLMAIQGNAFTYEPSPAQIPVDWLLSDVICEPPRALAQIRRWLLMGWCRRLVMTIKFKGQTGYGMLDDVRATLREAGCPAWRIKHLHHNKNEVTVMAVAPGAAADPRKRPPRPE
jgi:23S rRNA (cytidine2498-2'-O)-methyltransferase